MDVDEPASSAELNYLHYSCGYWKADVKIIDVKYVFRTMHTRGSNQERLHEDGDAQ